MLQQLKDNFSNFFEIISYVYSFMTEGYNMPKIYKTVGTLGLGAAALYGGKLYFNGGVADKRLFEQDLSGKVCIVTGASFGGRYGGGFNDKFTI